MRKAGHAARAGVLTLVLVVACSGLGTASLAWAQAFGVIAATVEKTDDARGLTVRSDPSDTAKAVGFLPIGTEIRSCNDFTNGWVRLETPSPGNWVNMAYLRPKGGEATVIAADTPELCLAVRKGPLSTYDKTRCAELGQKLQLSGVWSSTNWARLEDGGWVDASKIETDLFMCSTPVAEVPQNEVEPKADTGPPPEQPVVVAPGPPSSGEGWGYGSPVYGGFGLGFSFGNYGSFGYYPTPFPLISIARPWYRHHHHHYGRYPYARHHGPYHRRPGDNFNRYRNAANARAINRAYANRSLGTNAYRSLRSYNRGSSVSRAWSGSRALRSAGPRMRSAGINRSRAFRGAHIRGGHFRGGHFRGGGGRRR